MIKNFIVILKTSIALGNGADGYRATFNNIAAYGVSNLTVSNVRSDIETLQFQLTFEIPRIRTRAKYRSSGVLILIQASGSGDYWGDYGNCNFFFFNNDVYDKVTFIVILFKLSKM